MNIYENYIKESLNEMKPIAELYRASLGVDVADEDQLDTVEKVSELLKVIDKELVEAFVENHGTAVLIFDVLLNDGDMMENIPADIEASYRAIHKERYSTGYALDEVDEAAENVNEMLRMKRKTLSEEEIAQDAEVIAALNDLSEKQAIALTKLNEVTQKLA